LDRFKVYSLIQGVFSKYSKYIVRSRYVFKTYIIYIYSTTYIFFSQIYAKKKILLVYIFIVCTQSNGRNVVLSYVISLISRDSLLVTVSFTLPKRLKCQNGKLGRYLPTVEEISRVKYQKLPNLLVEISHFV